MRSELLISCSLHDTLLHNPVIYFIGTESLIAAARSLHDIFLRNPVVYLYYRVAGLDFESKSFWICGISMIFWRSFVHVGLWFVTTHSMVFWRSFVLEIVPIHFMYITYIPSLKCLGAFLRYHKSSDQILNKRLIVHQHSHCDHNSCFLSSGFRPINDDATYISAFQSSYSWT